MEIALEEARLGAKEGGVPIGSSLVNDQTGEVLGRGHNRRVQQLSPILHGEMDCLNNAGRLPASTYAQCTLYTTLSPCAMCSGAIVLFGIKRVVVAERDTFQGEESWLKERGVQIADASEEVRVECRALMEQFIREKPSVWNEDIAVEDE